MIWTLITKNEKTWPPDSQPIVVANSTGSGFIYDATCRLAKYEYDGEDCPYFRGYGDTIGLLWALIEPPA